MIPCARGLSSRGPWLACRPQPARSFGQGGPRPVPAGHTVARPRPPVCRGLLGVKDADQDGVDDDVETVLRRRIRELEDRLDLVEGTLTQLQEKMRDTSVSLVETLKDPSVDKMEQLQLQGAQDDERDIQDILSTFKETFSKGYMEACEKLRDRLLVTEWELSLKPLAMKQGVADFELYCAENKAPVAFEVLSALYDDPTNLEVIEDQHLRLRARACITQAVIDQQFKVHADCSERARALASQHQDLIAKILPDGGVVDAIKGLVVPHVTKAAAAVVPGN